MTVARVFLVVIGPLGFTLWVLIVVAALILVLMAIGLMRHLEAVRTERHRQRLETEFGPVFSRFLETQDAGSLADALRPAFLRMGAAERPVLALLTIELMGEASSPAQTEALRDALEQAGIVELGERGTRRFSPWRRALACETLGRIGAPRSVPALVERLNDRRAEVRMAAVRALGAIGSIEAVPALGDAFLQRRAAPTDMINDALRRIGGEAGTVFERGLATTDPIVRGSSCFGLAAIAGQRPGAVWRLAEVLALDSDVRVRAAAATALGIAGGHQVPDPLLAAANDPEVTVRRAAVKSLGSFDDPRCSPTLDERTEDEDRETAIRAAEALFALARRPRTATGAHARLESSSAWAVEYARIVAEVSA
ncbi:MAG TPA: HEAT repeat domain-containing protein [Solirubrobacteraceae bacterium]|jgi:HEAT repeat protein|nr:HEAT repeat domain-containing protein [Solirubrobacteraceae bacterium]